MCEEETASIVLHLIDYDNRKNKESQKEEKIIEKCRQVVEQKMRITVNKEGFNYYRFVQHMHYLLERAKKKQNNTLESDKMFKSVKEEYPRMYECALGIENILEIELNEEELLYLILHINRLCAREDCYQ